MCLVAFQKIFRKIFSGVWKRRRKTQIQKNTSHNPDPVRRQIQSDDRAVDRNPRSRSTARSRSHLLREITIDGAISRRRDRNLREIVIDGAILRSVNHDLRSSSLAYIRDLAIDASRDCDQRRLECLPARSRSARTGARSSPTIVGLTGMFLLLSRVRALSLSLSIKFPEIL